MGVLFFKPIPRLAIWGHTLVKDYFGYHDFPDGVGQAWSFSCQKGASNICETAPYQGKTLLELWQEHQELFGHPNEQFPVIISLVGPEDDLSIQVHPDVKAALKLGYQAGKNEAWYFIEAEPGAKIVYGHNAKDEADLTHYIKEEQWDKLIRHLEVHPDDFVYLPAGLLHALKNGSVVYEIQQATDVTFRFYDYHRKDANGNERELHLKEAIECLSYDQKEMENKLTTVMTSLENGEQTVFIDNDSFTVTKLELTGENHYYHDNYQLATVVRGSGTVDGVPIKVGDNFLIPQGNKIVFDGHMTIMMTTR